MNGNNVTYRQQYSFCNKPACRKCRAGIGHGPYWYAYQAVQGRTVRTYIGKTLPAGVEVEQAGVFPLSSVPTPAHPSPATPLFRLTTLGQVRLESCDENQNWQTLSEAGWRVPDVRALLCCLACAPGRQLTQQQAGELLWPGMDAKSAAQNLRRASTALAQLLGSGSLYGKQANNLLTLAGQAQFWVDCDAFEDLIDQARALPAEEKTARIAKLEQASELYQGDFFPEDRAASWLQERRKDLRRQWIAAILNLADLYLSEQRLAATMDLLNQLIAAEPANEEAVQRLMLLLARQQRRVEAMQAYQHLVTALNTTHQAAPSPETQALFHAIQQGREEHLILSEAATDKQIEIDEAGKEAEMRLKPKKHPTSQPDANDRSSDPRANASEADERAIQEISIGRVNQSPLVGRDSEVAALYQLLSQVEAMHNRQVSEGDGTHEPLQEAPRTPHAHCMMLMGEAGIGKTRLAEESAREAQRRGWTVIWSHAYSQEQSIPYRLWTAALRNVLTYTPELARQATEFASAAIYQPLRALVPEMQEALISAGNTSGAEAPAYDSLSPEQEELRLREAVYLFLATLSLSSPLLLVLDDIQWADDSSSQMLGYLTRRMSDHSIVILATCRETELAANRSLNNLIAHMQREQVVSLIHVQPLSDEQIGTLVSYLPEQAIAHIKNQAAGNPFFAEELAYSLQTSVIPDIPLPPASQQETQMLPGPIAAALNQRLNRLSYKCQKLLDKAAVLGGSFDFELIAAIENDGPAGDDDTVLDLLDEALRSGVLAEEGSGAHIIYHFWHPLLVGHLYQGLSETRRARLHRLIARVLRQRNTEHEGEEAATITQHLIKGGEEPAQIAHYAELAAHHAYSLFAYSEAEHYYRLALSYLAPALLDLQYAPEQAGQSDMPLEQRLHLAFLAERLAECARVRGNFQDAPNFYLRAIQLRTIPARTFATPAEEKQEAQIVAILWSEIAWIWRFTGDTSSARACNTRGQEVLQKAGITDGPAWGRLRHQQADLYSHEGYHQEALQASHQAMEFFAAFLAQAGQHTAAMARQTRTMRTLLGDPVDLGRAHASLGIYYTSVGQLSEALKHLQEALAIYEQHGRRREVSHVCCNIGHVYLLKANYAQAQLFLQRPQRYVEQSGDIPLKSVLLENMGELAAATGQLDEAEAFYRESLVLATQIKDREYLSIWNAILGMLLLQQGRFKESAEVILRALAIGRAVPPNQPCIGFALVALANLRCALVENEQDAGSARRSRMLRHAQADLRRALSLRGLDAEKRTQAQLAQAQVSRLAGKISLAKEQAQQALADAQTYELYALQARCQQLLDILS